MKTLNYSLHDAFGYQYIDEGLASDLPPVVLLHGMLGDITNWTATLRALVKRHYRVLIPVLPVHKLPMKQSNVQGLVAYVRGFLSALEVDPVVLAGNSLGGQIALFYVLHYPESVSALVLSGSSGIYELEMGTSTLRRRDRDFLRERAEITFYDPIHVTDEIVERGYRFANDRSIALRLLKLARSVKSETVIDRLAHIEIPTQLIWGRNDRITPPDVAELFQQRMPHAELHLIDRCGHAPMMEHPDIFNEMMLAFLHKTIRTGVLASSASAS
ncbi:MAG: alpha/beta fold hydrolase [Rhodothermales bacterium]